MRSIVFFVTLIAFAKSNAQQLVYPKKIIADLCAKEMHGRGYVNDGVNKAANYLEQEFKQLKLRKFGNSYSQSYSFPVNTFPTSIFCSLDGTKKIAGVDFILDAGCQSIQGKFNCLHFNMKNSLDKILLFKKIQKGFDIHDALVLHHLGSRDKTVYDSCQLYQHYPALFIPTEDKKLTYTVSRSLSAYPSVLFIDSAIVNEEHIEIDINNVFIDNFISKNLVGFIKGKNTDSFVVFSAHYDHLGMMGDAMFPGASDNASGVSMLLYLANYFSKNKPAYNTAFILFSGEEAGLLGSAYFVDNPMFDLKKVKMLINIDIMGNAENGITVVNGEVYKSQFDKLQQMNEYSKLLPAVNIRGKAKNSDHYYFSEKGIPSFFIYSNGGVGYYHDVFDVANSINLHNYQQVAQLLIEFVKK